MLSKNQLHSADFGFSEFFFMSWCHFLTWVESHLNQFVSQFPQHWDTDFCIGFFLSLHIWENYWPFPEVIDVVIAISLLCNSPRNRVHIWENLITSSCRKVNNLSRYANSGGTRCKSQFLNILSQCWENWLTNWRVKQLDFWNFRRKIEYVAKNSLLSSLHHLNQWLMLENTL